MSDGSLQVPTVSPAEAVDGGFMLVDVRSPREYAEGHVPGAVSLPFLDDTQRRRVGVVYRELGAQQARIAAMDLVAPSIADYLRSLLLLTRGGRRVAIMCWRGGERSRNVVLLLALVGVHAVRVEGGYKAYRRWVLDGLASWQPDRPVFTLFGETGSGKTAVLRALGRLSAEQEPPSAWVVDLEGLALHRGSLLGGLHQPGERTQKQFDSLVWDALRRPRGDYMVVEGEGGKIGRLFLPQAAAELVRRGIPVRVTAPRSERVRRLVSEYAPREWTDTDRARFRRSLELIGRRLPPEEVSYVSQAYAGGRFDAAVERLLVGYYDPLYKRSSVEGRTFALTLRTGPDPDADARRLATELGRLAGT